MNVRTMILALLILPALARCQEDEERFWLMGTTGYTTFQLSDMTDVMQSGVSWYNANGIPVKLQTNFPGNALFGVEGFRKFGMWRVGVGAYLSNTMGFFGVQDPGGLLKTKSTVHMYVLQGVLGRDLGELQGGTAFAELKPGFVWGVWDLTETVKFKDFPTYDRITVTDGTAWGAVVEGAMGWSYRIARGVAVEGRLGYRWTGNPSLHVGEAESNVGLNMGGAVASVSIGIRM